MVCWSQALLTFIYLLIIPEEHYADANGWDAPSQSADGNGHSWWTPRRKTAAESVVALLCGIGAGAWLQNHPDELEAMERSCPALLLVFGAVVLPSSSLAPK